MTKNELSVENKDLRRALEEAHELIADALGLDDEDDEDDLED